MKDEGVGKRALAGVGKKGDKLVIMLYVIAQGFNQKYQFGFDDAQLLALAGGLYVLADQLKDYLTSIDGGK